MLARSWKLRVKERDFYDYLWYLEKKTPIHLEHLEAKLIHSKHWDNKDKLTQQQCRLLFMNKFKSINIESARADVGPFLKPKDRESLQLWSNEYFVDSVNKILFC